MDEDTSGGQPGVIGFATAGHGMDIRAEQAKENKGAKR
jgi:hypothetical protein